MVEVREALEALETLDKLIFTMLPPPLKRGGVDDEPLIMSIPLSSTEMKLVTSDRILWALASFIDIARLWIRWIEILD